MNKLGICIAVLVGMVGSAHAQAPGSAPSEQAEVEIEDAPEAAPTPPASLAYDQCMAERRLTAAEASGTTDLKQRAHLYQSMPECHQDKAVAPAPVPALAQPPAMPQSESTDPVEIPEIKSPGAALALSLGMTATGLIMMNVSDSRVGLTAGAMMFLVGPTAGHIYAGEVWSAGLGLRLAGAGAGFLGLMAAFDNNSDGGAALFVGGSLLYIGATAYEIGTAPSAARDYNRKMASFKLVPIASPNAGGVSVVGSF